MDVNNPLKMVCIGIDPSPNLDVLNPPISSFRCCGKSPKNMKIQMESLSHSGCSMAIFRKPEGNYPIVIESDTGKCQVILG
jgi:hypothetical protein